MVGKDQLLRQYQFSGRVAVIAGGGGGIGRAAAHAFHALGAKIIVLDRAAHPGGMGQADAADDEFIEDWIQIDIADPDRVDAAFDWIRSKHGATDILVNSAGIVARKPAFEIAADEWRRVIDVNLTGLFLCSRAAARHMLPRARGSIVNIASIGAFFGGGLYPNPAYRASKGGVVNLTRTLAVEWAPHGIRVNAVAPSWVRTPLIDNVEADSELRSRVAKKVPLGRLAEPMEVASAILFLASDAASMITGHTLPVDGGALAQ